MKFDLAEAAEVVRGAVHFGGSALELNGATIDSRSVQPGNLFVAIEADRDGHEFLPPAMEAGAVAGLVSRRWPGLGAWSPEHGALIAVDDTGLALLELGKMARSRLPEPVVGITGSVGKTSTKDLVAAACSAGRRTHANPASFNNELGLPLTLLNAPPDTEVTILEMGARGQGHINHLCSIGKPSIGVVTRVALAHGEQFGSIDGVARAKSELIRQLPADGVAILNGDDERVAAMADLAASTVLTYGQNPEADVSVVDLSLDDDLRPRFVVRTPDGEAHVRLGVSGAHMAVNAAGAIAVALSVGVRLEDAVAGLAAAHLSAGRMQVGHNTRGAVIINDAYNANPTSVGAGLAALAELPSRRKVALLGVMAELGPDSVALHASVTKQARDLEIDVIAIGAPDYGAEAVHAVDAVEARRILGSLDAETSVLVKGSLVAGLQSLAEELLAE